MFTKLHNNLSSRSLGWNLVAVCMFAVGCFFTYKAIATSGMASSEPSVAELETTQVAAETTAHPKTRKIEDIRVGQRVWADNPEVETSAETAVDPATWKLLKLRAETVWDDGTVDDFHVETLQPPEWIEVFEAQVGSTVPLPLDLVEMGVSEELMAKVLAIERCPPLEEGPGRVVLTTVNHLNQYAFELTVEDARGHRETTQPTGHHKFYRPTDGAWVSVEALAAGDQLQNALGEPVTVVDVVRLAGTHRVYNLTVEGEHVYHVSSMGLLAHNNGCATTLDPYMARLSGWARSNRNPLNAPTSNVGRWSRTEFQGRRVFQRNDLFDPARRSSWVDPDSGQWVSGTNVERMRSGLAPVGTDRRPLQLHHLTGEEVHGVVGRTRGPVAEVTATFHQQNTATLHIPNARPNPNYVRGGNHPRSIPQYPSFRRDNLGNLTQEAADFDAFRSAYWQNRASGF